MDKESLHVCWLPLWKIKQASFFAQLPPDFSGERFPIGEQKGRCRGGQEAHPPPIPGAGRQPPFLHAGNITPN